MAAVICSRAAILVADRAEHLLDDSLDVDFLLAGLKFRGSQQSF
jgi:hypothetical protein